jgi:hypothetical protein
MTGCDDFIAKIEKNLPDPIMTFELVEIGIFRSIQSAYYARKNNKGPVYFEVGKKVFYPKAGVIEWLKECRRDDQNYKSYREEKTKSF